MIIKLKPEYPIEDFLQFIADLKSKRRLIRFSGLLKIIVSQKHGTQIMIEVRKFMIQGMVQNYIIIVLKKQPLLVVVINIYFFKKNSQKQKIRKQVIEFYGLHVNHKIWMIIPQKKELLGLIVLFQAIIWNRQGQKKQMLTFYQNLISKFHCLFRNKLHLKQVIIHTF